MEGGKLTQWCREAPPQKPGSAGPPAALGEVWSVQFCVVMRKHPEVKVH